MNVQCAICDKVEYINENSYEAKRLRSRGVSSYLCQSCHDRITEKTKKRHETGKFHLYSSNNKENK